MNCSFEVLESYGQPYCIDWTLVAKCCRHCAWNRVVLENSREVPVFGDSFFFALAESFSEVQLQCSRNELQKKVESMTESLLRPLSESHDPLFIAQQLRDDLTRATEDGTKYRRLLMRSTERTVEHIQRVEQYGEAGLNIARYISKGTGNILVTAAAFAPPGVNALFAVVGGALKAHATANYNDGTHVVFSYGSELLFAMVPVVGGRNLGWGVKLLIVNLANVKDAELALLDGASFSDVKWTTIKRVLFSPLQVGMSMAPLLQSVEPWASGGSSSMVFPGWGFVTMKAANFALPTVLRDLAGSGSPWNILGNQSRQLDVAAAKEGFAQEAPWDLDSIDKMVVFRVAPDTARYFAETTCPVSR